MLAPLLLSLVGRRTTTCLAAFEHLLLLASPPHWPLSSPGARADSAQGFIQTRQTQVTALLHQIARGPARQTDRRHSRRHDGLRGAGQALARDPLGRHVRNAAQGLHRHSRAPGSAQLRAQYQRHSRLQRRLPRRGPRAEGALVHTRASSTTDQREEPSPSTTARVAVYGTSG